MQIKIKKHLPQEKKAAHNTVAKRGKPRQSLALNELAHATQWHGALLDVVVQCVQEQFHTRGDILSIVLEIY